MDRRRVWLDLFRSLLWVAIVAQAMLVCWSLRPWIAGDTPAYLDLARGLSRGGYGVVTAHGVMPDVLRPPGYPIVLYILLYVVGLPVAAVVWLQIGIYLLTLLLIDRWLARRSIDPFLFRLIAAIYPFAAVYSANILTEAWVALALTGIALLLASEEFTIPRLIAAGAISGLATLFRVDLLLIPLMIAVLVAWKAFRIRAGFSWGLARSLAGLISAAAVLLPYSIWNLQHFGKLSPLPAATAFGNSLYTAYWQEILPNEDMVAFYMGRITPRARESGWADEVTRVNKSIGAPPGAGSENPVHDPTIRTRIASSPAFGRAAIKRIESNPSVYVKHVIKNVWLLWNTSRYPGVPAAAALLLFAISYSVWFAAMGGVTLSLLNARDWPLRPTPAFVMLYPWVVHLPMHLEARYTAAARPLLIMFAAMTLSWFIRRAFNWWPETRKPAQPRRNASA